MESEDIGTERNYILTPYQFTPQSACPFSLENTEEGEHHVPRTFDLFTRLPASPRVNRYVRPFIPNITLVPLQLVAQDLSDDSVVYSDDEPFCDRRLEIDSGRALHG